jgi:hypothetical protein
MDAALAAIATPTQRKYYEALERLKTTRAVAAEFGVHHSGVARAIQGLEARAGKPSKPDKHRIGDKLKIMVLPDVQAKPGLDFSYLMRYGTYLVEKKPDVLVCIGDFADMESLSAYDKGKKAFEVRRYRRDVEATHEAMAAFLAPLQEFNERAERNGRKQYHPRMVLCLGNHEERILRAINDDPKLDGVMSVDDLKYKEFGWEVHDFLEVVIIEGVAFSHYFTSGVMGRPVSSARACLTKKHMSTVQGHKQGLEIATDYRGDGAALTAVIAGSAYEHEEEYLGPQGNKHWRGFLMMHEVCDGSFDLMPVSLGYANQKYAHIKLPVDTAKHPVGAGEPA